MPSNKTRQRIVKLKNSHFLLILAFVVLRIGLLALKSFTVQQQHDIEQHNSFAVQRQYNVEQHAAPASESITVNLSAPDMVSRFLPGGTLIQTDTNFSAPNEQQLLQGALGYLNVFIMGWGTDNPEPSPGQYDWSTLDARVQAIRNMKLTPMISLCCAPDWMKGGQPGQTNWGALEVAPLLQHYADFAQLSAQVALRYKDVKYFQVWNEIKGFWDAPTQYIQLYNQVYDAIKIVRPDAKIGGPYISLGPGDTQMQNLISSWLMTKRGADFVVLDGGFASMNQTQDYSHAQFYRDITNWLRQQPDGGATLPIGWAEWYPGTMQNWDDLNHFNATMTNAMISTLRSGALYALTWGVEGGVSGVYQPGDGQQENLIAHGQPTPLYTSLKYLKDYFGPGTQTYKVTQTTQNVTALASKSKVLLVNHLGIAQTVTVNGVSVTLTPYQVTIIDTPNGNTPPNTQLNPSK